MLRRLVRLAVVARGGGGRGGPRAPLRALSSPARPVPPPGAYGGVRAEWEQPRGEDLDAGGSPTWMRAFVVRGDVAGAVKECARRGTGAEEAYHVFARALALVPRPESVAEAAGSTLPFDVLRAMAADGVQPSLVLLNHLGRFTSRWGDTVSLERLLAVFGVYGIEPDEHTHRSWVRAAVAAGDVEAVRDMWARLKRAGYHVRPARDWGYVLRSLSLGGHAGAAVQMLAGMARHRPQAVRSSMYNAVLTGMANRGEADEAEALVAAMAEGGWAPDQYTVAYLLDAHTLAVERSEAGVAEGRRATRRAAAVWRDRLGVPGAPPSFAHASWVRHLAVCGDARGAARAAEGMRKAVASEESGGGTRKANWKPVAALTYVAMRLVEDGSAEEALAASRRWAEPEWDGVHSWAPSAVPEAAALAELGRTAEAAEALARVPLRTVRASTMPALARMASKYAELLHNKVV